MAITYPPPPPPPHLLLMVSQQTPPPPPSGFCVGWMCVFVRGVLLLGEVGVLLWGGEVSTFGGGGGGVWVNIVVVLVEEVRWRESWI